MKIFIDESGVFANPNGKENCVSSVGALVIPECDYENTINQFECLKNRWSSKEKEIKGSKLNEDQISSLINKISNTNCLFYAVCVDLGLEVIERVDDHKKEQADKILKPIDKMNHESMRESLRELNHRINNLSVPQYVQFVALNSLISRVFRSSTCYYSQRIPDTLATFQWYIDEKNSVSPKFEEFWLTVLHPFLQSKSLKRPLLTLESGDYSYMKKFECNSPKYLKDTYGIDSNDGYDPSKIWGDNVKFLDSKKSLGIQLVDILTTSLRRAFSGTLQQCGWSNIGKLMVQAENGEKEIHMINISGINKKVPYAGIVQQAHKLCKPMLLSKA